jgi:hypothetical protein
MMRGGYEPVVGLCEPEAPDELSLGELWQPLFLLLVAAEGVDGVLKKRLVYESTKRSS